MGGSERGREGDILSTSPHATPHQLTKRPTSQQNSTTQEQNKTKQNRERGRQVKRHEARRTSLKTRENGAIRENETENGARKREGNVIKRDAMDEK